MQKKIFALASAIQKIDFWDPIFGGVSGGVTKEFWERKLRLKLNNFTQKLDFDVLWFREKSLQDLK